MIDIQGSKYTHRLLARFIIEATTPIAVGTGEKDIFTDAVVAKDVNGLPYIPGTTIAGVVRSMLDPDKNSELFGFQENKQGRGSEICFTEAKLLDSHGIPVDGIKAKSFIEGDSLLSKYASLPIRQHVRINDKGTATDMGKYDEQVVFAGSRFCFEIEIVSDKTHTDQLNTVIDSVKHESFRLGGGTRKGFGEISIVDLKCVTLDLTDTEQLAKYISKSSNLEESGKWQGWESADCGQKLYSGWKVYELEISPIDFMMFGSGYGDDEGNADMTTVKASKVRWTDDGKGGLEQQLVLIPATSLKGALRHRTAYHYNIKKGIRAEELSEEQMHDVLLNNETEIALFGCNKDNEFTRGNVILNDIIEQKATPKILQHIAVDRYTGGTIDGALFAEQVDYSAGKTYSTKILVNSNVKEEYLEAFEKSLKDLTEGKLPLGGGVNRGHGFFYGQIKRKECTNE